MHIWFVFPQVANQSHVFYSHFYLTKLCMSQYKNSRIYLKYMSHILQLFFFFLQGYVIYFSWFLFFMLLDSFDNFFQHLWNFAVRLLAFVAGFLYAFLEHQVPLDLFSSTFFYPFLSLPTHKVSSLRPIGFSV